MQMTLAKVKIWPWLAYLFPVRSTAVVCTFQKESSTRRSLRVSLPSTLRGT